MSDLILYVIIAFFAGIAAGYYTPPRDVIDQEKLKETANRAEAAARRAELAYGRAEVILKEEEKYIGEINKAVRLARHWALVKGAAKEDVLELDNWAEGWIKRRRDE